MGTIIVKINDYYLEWHTASNSPSTFGMSKEEFTVFYLQRYGASGWHQLEARMNRVDETGTSSLLVESSQDVILFNHLGPNGSKLTLDEIYQVYCLREPIRNGYEPFGDTFGDNGESSMKKYRIVVPGGGPHDNQQVLFRNAHQMDILPSGTLVLLIDNRIVLAYAPGCWVQAYCVPDMADE